MADLASQYETNPPPPDLMNDPDFATNAMHGDDGQNDPDTCRICRGEGGANEPLFYPCKCSGSIKFVHQECLMEWLSHSQKKYCELCKTPFRFTKLYSPQMPQKLPASVFARHLALKLVRNITTWLRFCLVVTVWLGILPFAIRQFWRFVFWFSDGGWPSPKLTSTGAISNTTTAQALEIARELQLATLTGNGTSPVTPLHASQTTAASIGGVIDRLVGLLLPFSQTLNVNSSDPLVAGLAKSLFYGFGLQNIGIMDGDLNNKSASQFIMGLSHSVRAPSLLSEVSFLNNLTRNPTINSLVITIVEGYVITFLVVVSFILVFLIREWVVQQQPGINMGAGFNADFAGPERRRGRQQPPLPNLQNVPNRNVPAFGANHGPGDRQGEERPDGDLARINRRVRFEDEHLRPAGDQLAIQEPLLDIRGDLDAGPGEASGNNRPLMPGRDAFDPAADLQRQLTEEPKMTAEFLEIWKRADGNATEILRIIEESNLSSEMAYWVTAMKILQIPEEKARRRSRNDLLQLESNSNGSPPALAPRTNSTSVTTARTSGESTPSSNDWVDITESVHATTSEATGSNNNSSNDQNLSASKWKGKQKENLRDLVQEPVPDPDAQAPPGSDIIRPPQTKLTRYQSSGGSTIPPGTIQEQKLNSQEGTLYPPSTWSFGSLPSASHDSASETRHTESSTAEPPLDHYEEEIPPLRKASSRGISANSRSNSTDERAWKEEQALRVEQAIARGREAHRGMAESATPGSPSKTNFGPSNSMQRQVPLDNQTGSFTSQQRHLDGYNHTSGEDPTTFLNENWDDFSDNSMPNSGTENQAMDHQNEPNVDIVAPFPPFPPFGVENNAPNDVQPAPAGRQQEPQGFLGQVADWLWARPDNEGQQAEDDADDEQIVEDLAAEAPFVPRQLADPDAFDEPENDRNPELLNQDRDVVAAALEAGLDPNDPDAIEDAEDFDGIMELVGMRGPLSGLLQNALFSAFLLALAVAIGIWIPYNLGRIALLFAANPGPTFKLPLRLIFGVAAFLQDFGLAFLGFVAYCVMYTFYFPVKVFFYFTGTSNTAIAEKLIDFGNEVLRIAYAAFDHGMHGTVNGVINVADSDLLAFSAASHESLLNIKSAAAFIFAEIGIRFQFLLSGQLRISLMDVWSFISGLATISWGFLAALPHILLRPNSWVISLEIAKRASPLDPGLSVWDSWDRFWATLTGYSTLTFLGALYINKGSPFSAGQAGREWEATIIDLLNQAGGVMKVILIISIEMLVFPLYCGLLLDAALLPLFENATIMSRILFTLRSPLTSIFVHWFVGTCYMFHFALFVSMCRKIMRKGVLYFIRDPDDPTFHPVRDVLERNVATQLRKILFSALVYGALVVICLGGVVWGIAFVFKGVLPIHWSSNEPVLEFPIDLLFYNFLMPLAVRFFKPSDGLHAMYSWWFRRCARMLRLTWFMFDERQRDEEGHYAFQNWSDVFNHLRGKVTPTNGAANAAIAPFIHDGRYVRTPASDQVRIPKESTVFLEVTEANERVDKAEDRADGLHGRDSSMFKQVYVPPHFRLRIFIFILSIWLFAAVTGVGITIVPLVFGRHVFSRLIPDHVRKNDVYAFSIGIYILGTILYTALHVRQFISYARRMAANNNTRQAWRRFTKIASRVGRVIWTYAAFLFVLPTLSAFLVEFYILIPLHTYYALEESHVMHFVQSWTLGLLYVKLTTRIILWYEDSRPAQSLRAITRNGYLNPDARLATRSFIFPATVVLGVLLGLPWAIASLACKTVFKNVSEREVMLIFRYSYPMLFSAVLVGMACWALVGVVRGWRQRIKDEVYLIGERLHNFGDRKTGNGGTVVPGVRRMGT
ncbi:hypothetical protein BP5796_10264 [Coleophoma crateriformis]|uniref:RING-type E3 ubiquitin transferase n=1 Tax=Coleophoma crateriformis TaxID=565419 RepID=A0A3D8QUX4_9HELO|nr:hypothetical protein BP5796_10264 [Coleophoma crateriformis]